jgi:hypothetical protein
MRKCLIVHSLFGNITFHKSEHFLEQQWQFDAKHYPNPFDFKDVSDWTDYVERLRQELDHLSGIANITR